MNTHQKDIYIAWLRDVHAFETALIVTLQKQAKDTAQMPALHSRIVAHLEETRGHAEKVAAVLERLGSDTSASKDALAKMTSGLQGLGMNLMDDVMVKNFHNAYAAEHFEIASYLTIRAVAEELGDAETVAVCTEILQDEYAMAEWVSEQLPQVAGEYMQREAEESGERETPREEVVDGRVRNTSARRA